MENIRELDDSVDAICGGLCACATCHVFIDPAWVNKLPQRQDEETLLISDSDNYVADQSRLSCQIQLTEDLDGLTFTIAPEEF
jgi:2Fe-2S ferredoxin